jgi:hypothetical protein
MSIKSDKPKIMIISRSAECSEDCCINMIIPKGERIIKKSILNGFIETENTIYQLKSFRSIEHLRGSRCSEIIIIDKLPSMELYNELRHFVRDESKIRFISDRW